MRPPWQRRRPMASAGRSRQAGSRRRRRAGVACLLALGLLAAPVAPAQPPTRDPQASAPPLTAAALAGSANASIAPTPAAVPPPAFRRLPPTDAALAPGPPSVDQLDLAGYRWPIRKARITTWFGPVRSGGFVVMDGQRVHDGMDLATFCGDAVRAAHDGVVLYAGRKFDPYLGYIEPPDAFYARLKARGDRLDSLPIVVVVDDGNGYRSVYVHLASASVHAGQRVVAGRTILGREGRTGDATGCHLHYTLIRTDGAFIPVAPEEVRMWAYPAFVRERVDPLLALDPRAPDAARQVPGIDPPDDSPSGPTRAAILAEWALRDRLPGPSHQ